MVLNISHSEPSAGGFQEETDRDPGSGVFVMNSGALGTPQVLEKPSLNQNNSIPVVYSPVISWVTPGNSPTSHFQ